MTEHSQNGWPASPALLTRTIVVDGASFKVADNRDVETVFTYLLTRYAAEVEPLIPAQCGGYNYRPNRNNPSQLSNHASATALDVNWLMHPNGVATSHTFTAAQIAAVHVIYASVPELSNLVHWGGDWSSPLTTDAMHHELHSHDLALLARVADRIRNEDDMTPDQAKQLDDITEVLAVIGAKVEDIDKVLKRITKSKREIIAAVEGDQ